MMEKHGSSSIGPSRNIVWGSITPVLHHIWISLHDRYPDDCTHPADVTGLLEDGHRYWDKDELLEEPELQWYIGYMVGFAEALRMSPPELIEEWIIYMERISFGRPWWESYMP